MAPEIFGSSRIAARNCKPEWCCCATAAWEFADRTCTTTRRHALTGQPRDIRVESYRRPELQAGMVLLRNRRVGICGSDLHYYEEGHCGASVPDLPRSE